MATRSGRRAYLREPPRGVRPLITLTAGILGFVAGAIGLGMLGAALGNPLEGCSPGSLNPIWCDEDIALWVGFVAGGGFGGVIGVLIGDGLISRLYGEGPSRTDRGKDRRWEAARPLLLGVAAAVIAAIPVLGYVAGWLLGSVAIHAGIVGAPQTPGKRSSVAIRAGAISLGAFALFIAAVNGYYGSETL